MASNQCFRFQAAAATNRLMRSPMTPFSKLQKWDHWDQAGVTDLFVDESYRYVLAFLITISTRKHMNVLTFPVVMIIKNQFIPN
ncbi:hypothetical protein Nit79A3_1502 [Nitrosomonas sp. Is79A3]